MFLYSMYLVGNERVYARASVKRENGRSFRPGLSNSQFQFSSSIVQELPWPSTQWYFIGMGAWSLVQIV